MGTHLQNIIFKKRNFRMKSLPGEGGTTNCGESPEAEDDVAAEKF